MIRNRQSISAKKLEDEDMTIETRRDLDALKRVGAIVSSVPATMLDRIEPGMTTAELDDIGGRLLPDHGARSAPQVMYRFPGATCISINEQAAHGIPGSRRINPGDLVNVEVSAELDGFYGPIDRRVLRDGMVIAIEPFLSTKSTQVYETDDGWTLAADSGNLSAQYQHTLIVTRGAPIILTSILTRH